MGTDSARFPVALYDPERERERDEVALLDAGR
jgi:hypothetical protein